MKVTVNGRYYSQYVTYKANCEKWSKNHCKVDTLDGKITLLLSSKCAVRKTVYSTLHCASRNLNQTCSIILLHHLNAVNMSFSHGREKKMKQTTKFGLNLNFSYRHTGKDTENISEIFHWKNNLSLDNIYESSVQIYTPFNFTAVSIILTTKVFFFLGKSGFKIIQ